MIIVVEGPDNAGKTTLAMGIAKELRALFMKVERPEKGSDLRRYCDIVDRAQDHSGKVVMDRHVCISEPIYGNICRGGHSLTTDDLKAAWFAIDVVIYCRPPIAQIMQSIETRPQMKGVVDNAMQIIHAYDEFFGRNSSMAEFGAPDIFAYDYTRHQPAEVISFIRQNEARR